MLGWQNGGAPIWRFSAMWGNGFALVRGPKDAPWNRALFFLAKIRSPIAKQWPAVGTIPSPKIGQRCPAGPFGQKIWTQRKEHDPRRGPVNGNDWGGHG